MNSQVIETKSVAETTKEALWQELAEDRLIQVYVPDAENYSRAYALGLALQRDRLAAEDLAASVQTELDLEAAAKKVRSENSFQFSGKALQSVNELGFKF